MFVVRNLRRTFALRELLRLVCGYVCMCVYVCFCIYVFSPQYICLCVCVCVYEFERAFGCIEYWDRPVSVRVYVWMYACVCVCVFEFVCLILREPLVEGVLRVADGCVCLACVYIRVRDCVCVDDFELAFELIECCASRVCIFVNNMYTHTCACVFIRLSNSFCVDRMLRGVGVCVCMCLGV